MARTVRSVLNRSGRLAQIGAWVVLCLALCSPQPALARTTTGTTANGQISGTIVDANTGQGVSGYCAWASTGNGVVGYAQPSAPDGSYTTSELPPGSYTVEFASCNGSSEYEPQYYDNATSPSSATPVSITAGQTTANIDASLVVGAQITGTVTDASGNDLQNICVGVFDSDGGVGSARTQSDGTYAVSGLRSGSYTVRFSDCASSEPYEAQWYDGTTDPDSATPVSVTAGQATANIDASMVVGGQITGTVTDSDGNALQGMCVSAIDASGNQYDSAASTDADGGYTIPDLPAGTYLVSFAPCSSPSTYLSQFYDDAPDRSEATLVSVTGGQTTSGIDAALASGGEITGTVTDAAGNGIENICVRAFDVDGHQGSANTGAGGTYAITGLVSGRYTLEFSDCGTGGGYQDQYYDDVTEQSEATPVSVTTGQTTANIDETLAGAGTISGTVTDASGHALANVCVQASSSTSGQSTGGQTSADGSYTISGLAPGSYTVGFRLCSGTGNYQPQYYDNVADASQATAVTVVAGQTTSNIDDALGAGGQVSGTVTDANGTPLQYACVLAYDGSVLNGAEATTGADGSYTISGLATGSYTVEFQACGAGNYLTQYYDGVTRQGQATPVAVTAGQTTSHIDDALGAGGQITGTVTDASGHALSGICVYAYDGTGDLNVATTAAQGSYTIPDLLTGSYTVVFGDCPNLFAYQTQYYDNATDPSQATPVSVTAGQTTSGIGAAMAPTDPAVLSVATSGSGSGSVSAFGIDCPDACQHAYADGTPVTLTATPAAGSSFAGWSGGGCSGMSPTCTLTMISDTTVTATFDAPPAAAGSGSAAPGGSGPSGTSLAFKLSAALSSILAPRGRAAGLRRVLKSDGYEIAVRAPRRATFKLTWYEPARGAHATRVKRGRPILIGSGAVTLHGAGIAQLRLRLTRAGRALLRHALHARLTGEGSVSSPGLPTMHAAKRFELSR